MCIRDSLCRYSWGFLAQYKSYRWWRSVCRSRFTIQNWNLLYKRNSKRICRKIQDKFNSFCKSLITATLTKISSPGCKSLRATIDMILPNLSSGRWIFQKKYYKPGVVKVYKGGVRSKGVARLKQKNTISIIYFTTKTNVFHHQQITMYWKQHP